MISLPSFVKEHKVKTGPLFLILIQGYDRLIDALKILTLIVVCYYRPSKKNRTAFMR